MNSDGESNFLGYFIRKGFKPEYLLSLGLAERLFFVAAMRQELEERDKLLKLLMGRR